MTEWATQVSTIPGEIIVIFVCGKAQTKEHSVLFFLFMFLMRLHSLSIFWDRENKHYIITIIFRYYLCDELYNFDIYRVGID